MMNWYKDIKTILAGEPESWLAYLHGQQLHNRPLLTQLKPRYTGISLQIAKFFAKLVRDFRLIRSPNLMPATFFVFADTANQLNALEQTLHSLKRQNQKALIVVNGEHKHIQANELQYTPFKLNLMDILSTLFLFSKRGMSLYKAVKEKHPVSVKWYFAHFCSVYTYLSYFHRVLSVVKPEFVVIANDHNVPHRCLLAVAHHMGIKTVYMQHASVSNLFPALRVNYAFLDGQCALDTYMECENNQPNTVRDVPTPTVILSGQKKHIKRLKSKDVNNRIGVAVNALDDAQAGIDFIDSLVKHGFDVRLRWHPAQSLSVTQKYRAAFSGNAHVSLSDPKEENISDFLSQICCLVAGNSSIHLEAALAGVVPIYYELTPADQPDYYGYVRHGLAECVRSVGELTDFLQKTRYNLSPKQQAVRYYSSTYLTEWDGREGELVALCLECLRTRRALPVKVTDFHVSK